MTPGDSPKTCPACGSGATMTVYTETGTIELCWDCKHPLLFNSVDQILGVEVTNDE
jgi:uncharacterized protein YbcV (DUF1398 family)